MSISQVWAAMYEFLSEISSTMPDCIPFMSRRDSNGIDVKSRQYPPLPPSPVCRRCYSAARPSSPSSPPLHRTNSWLASPRSDLLSNPRLVSSSSYVHEPEVLTNPNSGGLSLYREKEFLSLKTQAWELGFIEIEGSRLPG
ncbi:hypothetical protein CRG98_028622 [Punica granatum]|uniref:Uncharacterized protein n=1 Tax=Punica granatum TaxID=22663 RepID=A0A2I0J454_PUNGR|nr:hypothetical protein CRG98_028622 [Punica granatum]